MSFVELNPAFWWDCPQCKSRNFERGRIMTQEADGDTFALMQDEMVDIGEDDDVSVSELDAPMIRVPSDVICASCMVSFRSFPMGVSPEDFEEIEDDDNDN